MENLSNSIMLQKPDHATHNLSEQLKTTTHLGRLTPVYVQEVVPGDVVNISAEFLTKFQPIKTPAFQNFNAHIHYFYVPFRIMWKNWKYFISNTNTPGTNAKPVHPYIQFDNMPISDFNLPAHTKNMTYFGFTDKLAGHINPFPFIAYQMIFNEYYKHKAVDNTNDLLSSLFPVPDGLLNPTAFDDYHKELFKVRYRTYKDDYFTSALPSPQNGPSATLELISDSKMRVFRQENFGDLDTGVDLTAIGVPSGNPQPTGVPQKFSPGLFTGNLYIDMDDFESYITLNDMIQLNRMQEFLVRKNLSGSRYNEYILAFFGIRVPDLRVDRPDYICGIKTPVTVSEVLNTSNNQGYQTGQASSYSESDNTSYKVLEHGLIIGIYSVIPDIAYVKSVQRLYFKENFEDYYVPVFDQMGEREILNKELSIVHAFPDGVFGYIPQFSEYRMTFNKCTGEFTNSLSSWHLDRSFGSLVTLNDQFFNIHNPSRIFEITDYQLADAVLIWISHNVYINRPMKKYSLPTLTNDYGNNLS